VNPNAPSEEELKLPLTSPKLTMKLLNELIVELQQENQKLVRRLGEMERELKEQRMMLGEIAVTAEQLIWNAPNAPVNAVVADSVESEQPEPVFTEIPEFIRITRSEKHFMPKKRWFWF
jgi:predicted nucleotide-binding protein (sugar kinase/HSP70/actin superfamily)